MRKNLLLEKAVRLLLSIFAFLLLLFSIKGFGQTAIIPKLYLSSQNTPSGNTGWVITNATTNNASTDYWKMLNTNASLISPAMNLDSYTAESMVIKLGTFGTASAAKQTITVSISTNNGASWSSIGTRTPTASGSTAMTAFDLSSYAGTQVKVKFENLGGDASTGVRFYECYITGTAATPTITGAATASAFTTTYGTASAAQTFAVSGSNLTANLVATAPTTGFEVSADGTTYGNTATFTQTSGSASGTLSIRLKANAAVTGNYNAQNIVLSSTGATSVNITTAASGNSVSTKALTITANSQSVPQGTRISTVTGAGSYTATGFVNGETASVISGSATYTTTYTDTTPAGTSGVTITPIVTGLTATNYSFIPADGTITVTSTLQAPPVLTAATTATVDAAFDVIFTDDSAWRSAITSISIDGATLTAGYSITAGQITFTPSASVPASLLQSSANNKSIVVKATGYSDAMVTQNLGHGVDAKLTIVTQPTAPATNGGTLAAQPAIYIQDQYGNTTTSTATVTATPVQDTWTLGGTTGVAGVNGTTTFSGLTASSLGPVTGATITFTSPGLMPVTSNAFNLPAPPPPTLTAAAGATVDGPFTITFADNATWRAAITSITVGGTTLAAGAYSITAGQITFTPSADALLKSSGTKTIAVIATDYTIASVSQTIGAGSPTKLAIKTQPTAPATNGAALAAQPAIYIQDQYGNTTTSTATVTATPVQGTWTLGGTTGVAGVNGTTTFSGLTASSLGPVSNATITFTSPGLTSVTSNTFNLPAPPPPTLTAASGATVDGPFTITFADNATWRAAITSITVGGTPLAAGAYSITAGQITFTPSADALLKSSGTKTIAVIAKDYTSALVSQTIGAGSPTKLAIKTQPTAPAKNGAALVAQPAIYIQDQYGNTTTSTATVTASAVQGTWTLGGTTGVAAVNGTTTFSGLTATSAAAVTGATITFTSGTLTAVTSNAFNIPTPPPANDNCAGAIALTLNAAPITGDVTSATQSLAAFCTGTAEDDVWYSFTTANAGDYTIKVAGSASFDAVIEVRSGACNGTNLACANTSGSGGTETLVTNLSANTTYYVRVYDYGSGVPATTSFTIGIVQPPVATAATNISSSGFTANWNAVVGANTYLLDVFTISKSPQEVLNQNFNTFTSTGGNDGSWSGSIAGTSLAASDLANWTITSGYKADECVRIGTSSAQGSLQTPALGLSGNAVLTFRAGAWSGDSTQLNLEITGGGTLEMSSVAMTNGAFTSYTVGITGGTASTKITFKGRVASNSRFFLDDVKVVNSAVETPVTNSPFTVTAPTIFKDVTGITPSTTYNYRVRAVNGSSSLNSNVIQVTTRSGATTWNGTAWSDGAPLKDIDAILDGDYSGASFESKTITVNTGKTLTVNSFVKTGNVTNNGNIIVANNANFLQIGSFTSGDGASFKVRKDTKAVKRLAYMNWSSPMANSSQTLKQFSYGKNANGTAQSSTGTLDNRFYTYNNNAYVLTAPSGTFTKWQGYLIRTPNDFTTTPQIFHAQFEGTIPNAGNITYDHSSLQGNFILLGNPYPSAISYDDFMIQNTNTTGTVYVWNSQVEMVNNQYTGTIYNTFTSAGDNPANSLDAYIPVGQGFFVQRTDNNPFVFTDTMRRTKEVGVTSKSSTVSKNRFWLELASPSGAKPQMLLGFFPGTTKGIDKGYDAVLLDATTETLYSTVEDKKLIIDAHGGFDEADEFSLSANLTTGGNYTISLLQKEGIFSNGQKIYLKDNLTGAVTDLTTNKYEFTETTGLKSNRFTLQFKPSGVLGTQDLAKEGLNIISVGKEVRIKAGQNVATVEIYDLTGKKLIKVQPHQRETVINLSTEGMIVVKVTLQNGREKSKKLIIK